VGPTPGGGNTPTDGPSHCGRGNPGQEPDRPGRCGSPHRRPRRGDPARSCHRTKMRLGAWVTGGRQARNPGSRSRNGPPWRYGAARRRETAHRGVAGPPDRPGAFRSEPTPTTGRTAARPPSRSHRGSREREPQGREWLKQVTGSGEEQTVQAARNGGGGPTRAWNPATRWVGDARREPGGDGAPGSGLLGLGASEGRETSREEPSSAGSAVVRRARWRDGDRRTRSSRVRARPGAVPRTGRSNPAVPLPAGRGHGPGREAKGRRRSREA